MRNDDQSAAQKIGFLLLNDFSMLAFSAAIEPLRQANRQSNKELFDWVIASIDGNPSKASNGVVISCDGASDILQNCRMVFVCAGINVRANTDKSVLNIVRRLDRNG